jgi:F0F1-type ATP synthase membrane subunit b/b'
MALDMNRVEYDRIVAENILGKIRITQGVAILDELSLEVIEGEVRTQGWVDTRGEFMEVDLTLDMEGIDIASSYETFVSVERLLPMARFCRGTANMEMKYASKLDAAFTPLYGSINARGELFTRDLQFYNLDGFVRFSEMLKNEKFRAIAPDEVYVGFSVMDGRIRFNPFDMKVYDSEMTVSGSHGIDHTLDYVFDMNIAKSDLGPGANDMMRGLSVLAAGAGIRIPESDYIKVKANITGTFTEPSVKTDLSGNLRSGGETVREAVKAAVTERVEEEIEQVEEQVREEAGAKAEKIITDAEARAGQLVEEARKAGEELVKEAEVQGEKLVEEAGSNVLKQIAAKKAAEELKKQAVKQSENLVREAEVQAAEIIQRARDEAEKI